MADDADLAALIDAFEQTAMRLQSRRYGESESRIEAEAQHSATKDALFAALRRPAPPPAPDAALFDAADALAKNATEQGFMAAPPAHAELAGRLRARADKFKRRDWDEVADLLTEAANALEAP